MRWNNPQWWRRVQYGAVVAFAVGLPIGKLLAEASLVIGLLAWGVRILLERRRPLIPKSPLNVLLLLWFIAALCSLYNSIDAAASLKGLWKLLKYFALYLLVVESVDSRTSLRGVVNGCLFGLSLLVADGLWQAAFGRDLFYGKAPHFFEDARRIIATFDHPASLSIHLVSFCPLACAAGLVGRNRRWRSSLLGLTALATAVQLLTLTRGGLLGFLGSMAVLAYWLRHWAPAALAALAAWVQVATVPPAVKAWSATMPTLLEKLTQPERLMYWQAAVNMVKAHPVIGVGVNTFVKAYPSYRIPGDQYGEIGPYAHNQYLHMTAELGFVGLTIFLALLARLLLAVRRTVERRTAAPDEAVVSAGLGAGLVGYLIVGALESSLFYGRASMTFWLLAGLIVAADALSRRNATHH